MVEENRGGGSAGARSSLDPGDPQAIAPSTYVRLTPPGLRFRFGAIEASFARYNGGLREAALGRRALGVRCRDAPALRARMVAPAGISGRTRGRLVPGLARRLPLFPAVFRAFLARPRAAREAPDPAAEPPG